MADSTLTPAEIARIDAIVGPIIYERTVAPGLAARYDGACESVVRLHDETVSQRQRIAALEDELEAARSQLDAAILFRVGDVRISRARGRWEVGISHTSPRWRSAEPAEMHDRDRAFERARQLAEGNPVPPTDPRAREQLAAATWPSRAARRLEADAHPTTRSPR